MSGSPRTLAPYLFSTVKVCDEISVLNEVRSHLDRNGGGKR